MNILLRFRDTSEIDTIAEHQKIINSKGMVWWGWWKKDSEPERNELLSILIKDLSAHQFYFFDRSTEKFFYASISELAFKGTEKIPCPDGFSSPKYYSDEKLKLWLGVKEILEISKEEFLKTFGKLPTEDFSFFSSEDSVTARETSSLATKRVELKSDLILHISDIHLGDDYGFPPASKPNSRSLMDILVDYVTHDLKAQVGLLIVSGDITSRGNGDVLLNEGLAFLNELCKKLSILKDAVVIIPGNHDIPLSKANYTDYNHENTFRIFLEKFYGQAREPFGLDLFRFPSGFTLDLLKINSVKLRKKEESNYGYVDWFLYKNLLGTLKLDGDLKIAVIHHHLVSMSIEEILDPNYPYASISVTIDSGRVIEGLQKNGFNIVLNGHQHMPGITKISRGLVNDKNEMPMDPKSYLTILSAGSAGVKADRFGEELKYNSFSIYRVNAKSMDVEVRYYNPSIEPKRYYRSSIAF